MESSDWLVQNIFFQAESKRSTSVGPGESLAVAKVELQAGAYNTPVGKATRAHVTWFTCKVECWSPRRSSEP